MLLEECRTSTLGVDSVCMNSVRLEGFVCSEFMAAGFAVGRCLGMRVLLGLDRHEKNRHDVEGCGMDVRTADSDGTATGGCLDNPLKTI